MIAQLPESHRALQASLRAFCEEQVKPRLVGGHAPLGAISGGTGSVVIGARLGAEPK